MLQIKGEYVNILHTTYRGTSVTWLSSCRDFSLTSRSSAWAWASLSLRVISLSCSSFMAFFFGDSFQWPPPPPRDMWCCRNSAQASIPFCSKCVKGEHTHTHVCPFYLPALVELGDSFLHLSEGAQCLQLPQLHLLHLLLQDSQVVLIRQTTAPLDRKQIVWFKLCCDLTAAATGAGITSW